MPLSESVGSTISAVEIHAGLSMREKVSDDLEEQRVAPRKHGDFLILLVMLSTLSCTISAAIFPPVLFIESVPFVIVAVPLRVCCTADSCVLCTSRRLTPESDHVWCTFGAFAMSSRARRLSR